MNRVLLTALLAAVLAACGTEADPGPGSDSPVTSSPDGPTPPPTPTPRLVRPVEDLEDVRLAAWEEVVELGPRLIQVNFYGGARECYGVDRVDVDHSDQEVVVTLYTGTRPGVEACIDIAEYLAVRVPLDEPIGNRPIVDGSR